MIEETARMQECYGCLQRKLIHARMNIHVNYKVGQKSGATDSRPYNSVKYETEQERDCLVHFRLLAEACKVHEAATLLLVTLPNIHRLKNFTHRLSDKPFLIWLLKTAPDLKYVATLPCNLSLVAYFADARCGGFFFIPVKLHNLRRNHSVNFFNWSKYGRIMDKSLWPHFLAHPVLRFDKAAE